MSDEGRYDKLDQWARDMRAGRYDWVVQYRCGCSTTVHRLREQPGYCSKHGSNVMNRYRVPVGSDADTPDPEDDTDDE